MFDEIRAQCTRFQSGDLAERGRAYGWLVRSQPFMAVVEQLCHEHLSLHEVAALLAQGAQGAMAEHAQRLLKAAISSP